MKHILRWSFAVCALLLTLVSCNTELVQPGGSDYTLELSAAAVEVQAGGGEASVTITTTATEWSFMMAEKWISATKSGNELRLVVSPNATGKARQATLLVMAGQKSEPFTISQAVGSSSISTNESTRTVGQFGDTFVVPVLATSSDWSVKVSESWLKATPNVLKGTLTLEVPANTERYDRSAFVVLTDNLSGDTYAMEVKQEGIMYFILPYLTFGDGIDPIIAFEEARKSEITERPDPDSYLNRDTWKFRTLSKLFSRVEYKMSGEHLASATLIGPRSVVIDEISAMEAYLVSQGFQVTGELEYFHSGLEAFVEVYYVDYAETEVAYRFSFHPTQTKDYPTFSEFPLGFAKEAGAFTANEERVKTWETARGWTTEDKYRSINTYAETVSVSYFPSKEVDATLTRYTWSSKSADAARPLKSIATSYLDNEQITSRFFWEVKGSHFITKEFLQLAADAGYSYMGTDAAKRHRFVSKTHSFTVQLVISTFEWMGDYVITEVTPL